MKQLRCAIYTRKSSDEGLEQSFNSLDAQREACGAYILSQASEGWAATKDLYDDGGISGGTLERPELKRLLMDIAAGRIDIVVVYKVDRLTRSLLDFSKLVEAFDKAGVEFVSVTQSFNTTSSMGRLTLNMLLSFAQFEREVTAERIRDKIAASKARGMWMGGVPPIGYRPDGRTLAIVEEHAHLVQTIFALYLELGTVRLLAEALERTGLLAPDRFTASGRTIGGRPLSRGQLRLMLKNRIYLGEIAHRGKVHPGLHPPIVERELWERVQAKLADNLQGRRARYERRRDLLAGKLVDGAGATLVQTHSCKAGSAGTVRYRYYTSRALQHGMAGEGMRIPAREIERLVTQRIGQALDDPLALAATAWLDLPADRLAKIDQRARGLAAAVRQGRRKAIEPLLEQARIGERDVTIACSTGGIAAALGVTLVPGAPEQITLICAVRLRRSGMAMKLVQDDGAAPVAADQQALIRLLVQARRWWVELRKGEINVTALAARQGCSASYITRVLRLAFLSPQVVDAILNGTQAARVDVRLLTLQQELAVSWRDQEQVLLAHGQ